MPSGFYARAIGRSPAPVEILNKFAALESESSNEDSELQDLMGQHEEEELRIFIEAQRAFEEQAAEETEHKEGTLNAIEPPPPAPRGPCESQCSGTCGHKILCARTRRRRQGFAGHSTQR